MAWGGARTWARGAWSSRSNASVACAACPRAGIDDAGRSRPAQRAAWCGATARLDVGRRGPSIIGLRPRPRRRHPSTVKVPGLNGRRSSPSAPPTSPSCATAHAHWGDNRLGALGRAKAAAGRRRAGYRAHAHRERRLHQQAVSRDGRAWVGGTRCSALTPGASPAAAATSSTGTPAPRGQQQRAAQRSPRVGRRSRTSTSTPPPAREHHAPRIERRAEGGDARARGSRRR